MAIRINNLSIPVSEENFSLTENERLQAALQKQLGIPSSSITGFTIQKKSLDARRKNKINNLYQLDVELRDQGTVLKANPEIKPSKVPSISNPWEGTEEAQFRHRPIIVGSGPAGSYAALLLAEAGHKPIILERGEPVNKRIKTVSRFATKSEFNERSNYCFGEGGAGTFSDGKLTCGRNHPLIRFVFDQFVAHGAPRQILYDSHPHMGTDSLLKIAIKMRNHVESRGGLYRFSTALKDFRCGGSKSRYIVELENGEEIPTDHLILAIGHSARDTFEMLLENNVSIVQKPFAVGARIEHPQAVIDEIQFGSCQLLPAAEYKLASRVGKRGIWTFCMCPGGHLVPTNAQPNHLAINGMSYQARNSKFANAAVVVNVLKEDFDRGHPLDGMRFQEKFERTAFKAGGSNYHAPGQRLVDFIKGRSSKGNLISTYKPGVVNARMDKVLPEFVVDALSTAMSDYDKRMRGYINDEALVVGLESKTSSPVSITRDKSNFQSLSHPGLFPTGEGAGYAGGIISAALDGVKVARAVLQDATVNAKATQSKNFQA